MKLTLNSKQSAGECTMGDLYVNGRWQCFTLEDAVREVPGQPVSAWKVYGKTAIPAGTYEIVMRYSPHFWRMMPTLVGVNGFVGVLVHWGNSAADTDGCILVGQVRNATTISRSRAAFDALLTQIEEALARQERVFIEINRSK